MKKKSVAALFTAACLAAGSLAGCSGASSTASSEASDNTFELLSGFRRGAQSVRGVSGGIFNPEAPGRGRFSGGCEDTSGRILHGDRVNPAEP